MREISASLAALNAAWAAHFDTRNEEDAATTWAAVGLAEKVWAESLRRDGDGARQR